MLIPRGCVKLLIVFICVTLIERTYLVLVTGCFSVYVTGLNICFQARERFTIKMNLCATLPLCSYDNFMLPNGHALWTNLTHSGPDSTIKMFISRLTQLKRITASSDSNKYQLRHINDTSLIVMAIQTRQLKCFLWWQKLVAPVQSLLNSFCCHGYLYM